MGSLINNLPNEQEQVIPGIQRQDISVSYYTKWILLLLIPNQSAWKAGLGITQGVHSRIVYHLALTTLSWGRAFVCRGDDAPRASAFGTELP